MSRHTPGDWLGDFGQDGSFTIHVGESWYPGYFVICDRPGVYHRAEESIANGRLILAAPRLYESHEPDREGPEFLEFIADRLVHIHGDPEHADYVLALRRRASKARSAIANAEGRQP